MKYVASCSFGKDSLAMLIKIKELNLPLDEVIYCEIMFDNELSGETPEMYQFIQKAEKILKEQFNIKVTHLRGISFKEQFYKIKQKGNHIGDNYGFPYVIGSWCNSRLKIEPILKYFRGKKDIIQYVGIAYGETERYERLNHETHRCPLYELKITEEEAMEICKKYDLVSPIYKTSFRGGCWFCPKQSIGQLRWLYKEHKDLWNILKNIEKDSHNTFRPNQTITQLEERFKEEEKHTTIYDFIGE